MKKLLMVLCGLALLTASQSTAIAENKRNVAVQKTTSVRNASVKSPKKEQNSRRIKYVKQPLRIGLSWNASLETGVLLNKGLEASERFFFSWNAGFLYMYEPWILTVGVGNKYGGQPSTTLFFQTQLVHLWSGFWGQTAIGTNYGFDQGYVSLAAGFSVLGFEWQRRITEGNCKQNIYIIKLMVPIGIIFFAS